MQAVKKKNLPKAEAVFQILTTGRPVLSTTQLASKLNFLGVPTSWANGHKGYLASDRSAGIWTWLKETDIPFLIQCDEDIIPPVNITDLTKHDVDFVVAPALVVLETEPTVNICVFEEDMPAWPGEGLVKVDWAGTGAICYKRSAMEKFVKVYGAPFSYDMHPDGTRKDGVDVHFCRKARNIGLEVWADRGMLCGHHRRMTIVPGKDGKIKFRRLGHFWLGDDVDNYTVGLDDIIKKTALYIEREEFLLKDGKKK